MVFVLCVLVEPCLQIARKSSPLIFGILSAKKLFESTVMRFLVHCPSSRLNFFKSDIEISLKSSYQS
jgi:hypothetical protein